MAGAAEVEGTLEETAARFGALWRLARQVAEENVAGRTATHSLS